MTTSGDSEAKAREIVDAYFEGNPMDKGFRNAVSAISSALDEAVRGERDACAKAAENALGYGGVPCKQAAAAIRSRGESNG